MHAEVMVRDEHRVAPIAEDRCRALHVESRQAVESGEAEHDRRAEESPTAPDAEKAPRAPGPIASPERTGHVDLVAG